MPGSFTIIISLFAIIMGLNLLGFVRFQLPNAPSLDFIKNNTNLDMPSFIDKVKSKNKRVLVYPVHEY